MVVRLKALSHVSYTQIEYFKSQESEQIATQKKYDQLSAAVETKNETITILENRVDSMKNGLADTILLCEDTPETRVWWDSQPESADRTAILDYVFSNPSQKLIKEEILLWAEERSNPKTSTLKDCPKKAIPHVKESPVPNILTATGGSFETMMEDEIDDMINEPRV